MADVRALFRATHPSGARTLYVAGTGDDRASGATTSSAKRTIQGAIDVAQAGDRILVGNGTYGYTLFWQKHGTASAWITVESVPGARPVIDVSRSTTSYDPSLMTNGIDVQLSSYVAVFGLEVRGDQRSPDPNPSGIAVFRASSHIAIWACNVHDFPGGGVNCFAVGETQFGSQVLPGGGWDAVDVAFCTVHATSRRSPMNTSGISFTGGQDLTATTIDGRYGYRAVGNHVYDVVCTVPYRAGGFDFVTDGNGISPDSLAIPTSLVPGVLPYRKRGLIDSNVVVACGGRAVHVFNTKDIDVVNNTFVGNLRTASPAISGSTEVDVALDDGDRANGVVIANNLIAPMHTDRAFDTLAQVVRGNTAVGGRDAVPFGNQSLRGMGLRVFRTTPTAAGLAAGTPVSALTPVLQTWVPKQGAGLGYGALGAARTKRSTVVVGALE